MIDLSGLTAAPWRYQEECPEQDADVGVFGPNGEVIAFGDVMACVNLGFVTLARNAFDVMLRRLWHPVVMNVSLEENNYVGRNKWTVAGIGLKPPEGPFFDDPFTALVEADRWLTEQENAR